MVDHVAELLELAQRGALGALPIGTRVVKTSSAPGETHVDGAGGVVVGSLPETLGYFCYFVEWDDLPSIPVFVAGVRLRVP